MDSIFKVFNELPNLDIEIKKWLLLLLNEVDIIKQSDGFLLAIFLKSESEVFNVRTRAFLMSHVSFNKY